MIYLSYFVCCGDYIIHEKGGHCFFSLKSDVNLGTIRFYIKRKVVNLTLPQVYAGLTYGKGVLNETFIDPHQQNRGFMA